MTLTKAYTLTYGQFSEFFGALQKGQAPEKFTHQHLKDIGFASSNHRAYIPLLKALGFLSEDGTPTQRYHEYRDKSKAKKVMGGAIKEAYTDLFTIRETPSEDDRELIQGKFKSVHNVTDNVADLMTKTFFGLLELSELEQLEETIPNPVEAEEVDNVEPESQSQTYSENRPSPTFHYNIQIHLPATKDIEVYSAIFKSLKEHIIE